MPITSAKTPRVLVLGAAGMLGHKLIQRLVLRGLWVAGTIRSTAIPNSASVEASLGRADRIFEGIDVLDDRQLARTVEAARPEVIVNAVGIIKQIDAARDPVTSVATNALLPHRIAALAAQKGIRLIHFSTDCVFSGRKGPYAEEALPDPVDLYGRGKLAGETGGTHCLTLRTSIIGRELRGRAGLVEWFISQKGGAATGYAHALYSGLTTITIADLIGRLITEYPELDGCWHVASAAISKYDLLAMVNRHYGLGITLVRDENVVVDRRLDGSRFRERTGFSAPSWDAMIAEMATDPTPYES
jgi:dTDP-4-dehydrorhamnose reductase